MKVEVEAILAVRKVPEVGLRDLYRYMIVAGGHVFRIGEMSQIFAGDEVEISQETIGAPHWEDGAWGPHFKVVGKDAITTATYCHHDGLAKYHLEELAARLVPGLPGPIQIEEWGRTRVP